MAAFGALVLVHTIFGMPILTLLFRNYFSSVPEELFKAAPRRWCPDSGAYTSRSCCRCRSDLRRRDHHTGHRIWNDFLFGVVYTRPEYYPMTVQLNNIVNSVQA